MNSRPVMRGTAALFLLLFISAHAIAASAYAYAQDTDGNVWPLGTPFDYYALAQEFKLSSNATITEIKVYVENKGATGALNLAIVPMYDGDPLWSKNVTVSGGPTWVVATLSLQLDAGTYYLRVAYANPDDLDGYYNVYVTASGPSDLTLYYYYYDDTTNSASWYATDAKDLAGYIEIEVPDTDPVSGLTGLPDSGFTLENAAAAALGLVIFNFIVFGIVFPIYSFRIEEYGAGFLSLFWAVFSTVAAYSYLVGWYFLMIVFGLLALGVVAVAWKRRQGLTDTWRW